MIIFVEIQTFAKSNIVTQDASIYYLLLPL